MSRFLDKLRFQVEPKKKTTIVLTDRLRYIDRKRRLFTVPEGFSCDLASVPKIFRSLATNWNQSARAGVLHDCMYRWAEVWKIPRKESDQIYRRALMDDGVSGMRAWLQYIALRIGASDSWYDWRGTHAKNKGIRPKMFRL